MDRNSAAERDRIEQERQKCNAEQAVSKHFEESLRRAKEKVSFRYPKKSSCRKILSFPNHMRRVQASEMITIRPDRSTDR